MTTPEQQKLIESLTNERFKPYLDEAAGRFTDPIEAEDRALELYKWAMELAGLFHVQICYLEVALRNALSREIEAWNSSQIGASVWTSKRETALDNVIDSRKIRKASNDTKKDKGQSYTPNYHDIIAKLTFGFWVNLLQDEETNPAKYHWLSPDKLKQNLHDKRRRNNYRAQLWASCLEKSFPFRQRNESLSADREQISKQVSSIHQLRNRISHHDNILKVRYGNRLHEILGLLGSIGGQKLVDESLFIPLREHIQADPRKRWNSHAPGLDPKLSENF